MSTKTPSYAYVLAVGYGLIGFIVPASLFFNTTLTIAILLLIGGGIFGFVWPKNSWRWGLWIAGPIFFFLGLSVLFAGQLGVFLQKDLPPMLVALGAACLGSFISARFKRRQLARNY